MPRNDTGTTQKQRDRAVAKAHRLLAEGKSVRVAAADAGADTGVSEATVRRWAQKAGRPLTHASEKAEQARAGAVRKRRAEVLLTAERQREQVQAALRMTAQQIAVLQRQKPGERDTLVLSRVATTLARLATADAALLARLGPTPGDEVPTPPDRADESAEEAAARLISEWRGERDAFAGEGGE